MKQLGMYVHMHWSYNHPYSARTWSIDDWWGFAGGLKALGFNMVMLWPMTETIPDPPTPSDGARMEEFGRVISMLQNEFDMTVLVTLGPNTVGNEKASKYTWEERPFFETDLRLDPGDPQAVEELLRRRKAILEPISHADGFVIIDSDPGGYIGSTNDEFANLLKSHLDMLKEMNPDTMVYYWMWVGWEGYNNFWKRVQETGDTSMPTSEDDWETVIRSMMEWPDDSWGLLGNYKGHINVIKRLGVMEKVIFNPYGTVEGEPTFPLTNYTPEEIERSLLTYINEPGFCGIMANAQTHAVQQPNIYFFSHFAQGGTMENADPVGFADGLVPGLGVLINEAWKLRNGKNTAKMREIAEQLLAASQRNHPEGKYSGLLLGKPKRFLSDLAMQLNFTADMYDFIEAVNSDGNYELKLKALANSWKTWADQTGFGDAYYGPICRDLHPALRKLDNSRINTVLDDFDNWREPRARHGIVKKMLDVIG